MSSYNTVPDLESEAQPLVAAPPRKLGKTLVVVALFGFAAGAAVATAAPHVAAKMNLVGGGDEVDMDYDTSGRLTNDVYNGPSIDIDGDTPAAKMATPDQEPAQDPAIVNYIPGAVQSSQSTDCNKAGGETVTTNPDCSDAIIQDAQETGGTGGETARM